MANHRENSQVTAVLNHLLSGEEISPLQALKEYGVFRLSAVIFKIKKDGYVVSQRMQTFVKPNGQKGEFAVYKMEVCAV